MSNSKAQQSIPVIIKGGSKSGILAKPIEIQANSSFQVTEEFHSQSNQWIQSDSDFTVSYIESVMIGEMGENLQFCQTSSMTHPLTFTFKDLNNKDIFTIKEVTDNNNYSLQISVTLPDDYFQIPQTSESSNDNWSNSVFDTADAEVYAVEVTDINDVPVCRLLRNGESDIYLNLEPPV